MMTTISRTKAPAPSSRIKTAVALAGVALAAVGCSSSGAAAEFIDAEPSAAALAAASEDSPAASSAAGLLTADAQALTGSVIAQSLGAETTDLNALITSIVGSFESAIKGANPKQKTAAEHVWVVGAKDGLTLRFTIKKAADAHFGWLGEVKKSGDPDSAYQKVLGASFKRDKSISTAGRGSAPRRTSGSVTIGGEHGHGSLVGRPLNQRPVVHERSLMRQHDGAILRDSARVQTGDPITVRLARGVISAEVKSTIKIVPLASGER